MITTGQKVLPDQGARRWDTRSSIPNLADALREIFTRKPEPPEGSRSHRPMPARDRTIESPGEWPTSLEEVSPAPAPRRTSSARVRMTPARALRGRRSANRAEGANQAGYFGRTLDDRSAAVRRRVPWPRRALASARRTLADGCVAVRRRAGRTDALAPGPDQALEGVGHLARAGEPLVRLVGEHLVEDADEARGRSGRCSVIGTCRPLIRLPSRSIGDGPGNGSFPVIK